MRSGFRQFIAVYSRLKAQPRNLLAIGILISIVSLGPASGRLPVSAGASADSKALISLYADGQQHILSSDDKTVGAVLMHAGVHLNPDDLVEPAATSPVPAGQFNINVYRARPVLVQDGFKVYHLSSAYQSPRLLALAAGLIVYPQDTYDTAVITDIAGTGAVGELVTVHRSKPITVQADGTTRELRTQAATVGQALADAHIPLGASDTLTVPASEPVLTGMTIGITRVSEAVVTVTDVLPHDTKTINDPTMMKGQSTVKDPGSDGQRTNIYRIHYKDGVETSRELVKKVSEVKPKSAIIVQGTKQIFAGSVEYWRPQVEAAAAQWGLDPNMMLRIMTCESHGNALSVSHFTINGEHPTGLYQFLPSTWRSAGGTDSNIFDGSVQITLAARKMAHEGTSAWQCK